MSSNEEFFTKLTETLEKAFVDQFVFSGQAAPKYPLFLSCPVTFPYDP